MNKKRIALVVALVLLLTMVVGGTIAWLVDNTEALVNTFTSSDVDITLTETNVDEGSENANSYQMIPGFTIAKDPKVTVLADSEKCYVFVKVEKSENFDQYMEYQMATGWLQDNALPENVFYRIVDKGTANQEFPVILNNQVNVKGEVTKAMMETIEKDSTKAPTLTFTAYATQYYKNNTADSEAGKAFTPAEAWANVNAE